MKIGGFLRTEVNVHAAGSFTPFTNGSNAFQYRGEDNYITRARGVVTFDVREQTNWGTLRAYIAGGWQYSSNDAPTLSLAGAAVAAGGVLIRCFPWPVRNLIPSAQLGIA